MTLAEFELKIQQICVENGWTITLEYKRIWYIVVYDKESGQKLGASGSIRLDGVLKLLEISFDDRVAWA